jgi:hypothetical protein
MDNKIIDNNEDIQQTTISNTSELIHPEEYRYRITAFHRYIEDIIEQKILINQLWPKPIEFEHNGIKIIMNYKERPKEIEELDSYLQTAIDNTFQNIVVEGKF